MSFYTDYEHVKAPYSVRIVKFGCENCGRRWQSANGSLHDFQKCKNCYEKCYPSSYKIQAPNKRGNENRGTFQAHNTELCGRCERLGYPCMELGNALDEDNLLVTGADDEDVTLTKSNDLLSYIVEPKSKKGKKKTKSELAPKKSPVKSLNIVNSSSFEISNAEHFISLLKIDESVYYNKNDVMLDLSQYNYYNDEAKMYDDNFYSTFNVEDDQ